VLENAGNPGITLCVWLVSGLISLIGAICFTELGTMIQTDGGTYAYINEAYGHLLAFLYTWMMVFVAFPGLNAVAALTISMYIVKLFYHTCDAPAVVVKLIAAFVICK
jgi:L-type amino acid transporter 5